MTENKLLRALQSRKLWMSVIGLVLILVTAWQQDPFPTEAVVTAIMGVVGAYVAATAWEDGKQAEAVGNMAAPPTPPAVDIAANTVNVGTAEGNPPQPFIDTTGLR